MTRRSEGEEAAGRIAEAVLAEAGLELHEVSLSGPGRSRVLRFAVDRPGGGVTVDELQGASRALDAALEAAGVIDGPYHLEVSSPGIGRPWKRLRDFERNVGARVAVKLFAPLPDGRRSLEATVLGVEGETVHLRPDSGSPASVPFANIASARPEIDWAALLRGAAAPGKPAGGQGGDPHEP